MPSFVNINRKYKITLFTLDKGSGRITPEAKPIITDPLHFTFTYTVAVSCVNVATFSFYNLNEDIIKKMSTGDNIGFILNCWYAGGVVPNLSSDEVIFKGLIFRTNTYRTNTDLITEVVAFSSTFVSSKGKISLKFPKNTPSIQLLKDCLQKLGVVANIQGANYIDLVYNSPSAVVNKGFNEIVKTVAADNGCFYYITSDEIVFFPNIKSNKEKIPIGSPIQISTKNGMIGNIRAEGLSVQLIPVDYFSEKSLDKNLPILTVTTLLRKVALFSVVTLTDPEQKIYNTYKWGVLGAGFSGEYRGSTWYTSLKLAPIFD